ncbi:Hypothetical protein A7982_08767 [Minicystis rosea]|nr:Hypothetical protein A7982_08767 [Minicystis rosea]
MEPFRAPRPTCARCAAPNPDHLSPSGDLVCRACAVLPALDARMAQGKREGKAGAIAAVVIGIMLIVGTLALGIPSLSGPGYGKRFNARLIGLGLGLGIVALVAGVRNLRLYKS